MKDLIIGCPRRRLIFFLLVGIIFYSLSPLYSKAEKKGLGLIRSGEALYQEAEYEKAKAKFEKARECIYTDKNWLRLYKNLSIVYYALGKKKESEDYIMKALEIKPTARVSGNINVAPAFLLMFLKIRNRLKELSFEVRSLADRKLFSEARKKLEQSEEFKNYKNNKQVQELKNYIKEAEYKEKGRNMN